MKKIALAGVGLLALASAAAVAADLPSPSFAQPSAPIAAGVPAFTWTGFYVGVQGGGVLGGDFDFREANPPAGVAPITAQASVGGFLAGGQAGYNYQVGNFVLGVEGDFAYSDFGNRVSLNVPGVGGGFLRAAADGFLGTATGRIGYAMGNTLLYAKGGYAFVDTTYQGGITGFPTRTRNLGLDGWTVGAGVEAAVWGGMTVKAEYQYLNFDPKTVNLGTAAFPAPVRAELDSHVLKVGMNYKFDSFGGFFR